MTHRTPPPNAANPETGEWHPEAWLSPPEDDGVEIVDLDSEPEPDGY